MIHDSNRTISEFLSATAARAPIPGGGSVTALVGALAAALGEMVVQYSVGKKGLEPFEGELRPALTELARARELLLRLMVEDQEAYLAFAAASKLPAGSPERAAQLPPALLACVRTPQAIAAVGTRLLALCDGLVNFVNHQLLSDLAVCADLAMASIRCAVYSVRANLPAVEDPADRQAIEETVGQILSHAIKLVQNVSPRIWDRVAQAT